MPKSPRECSADQPHLSLVPGGSEFPPLPEIIHPVAKLHLTRMFRDPYVLEGHEKAELLLQLRRAVAVAPEMSDLRVLLGMVLCVNLDPQAALEELREAVRLAPESFIAHLKFGELLMRLRVCNQAEEETHLAARLADNPVQAEMARRQAATLRTMLREGIERGGYDGLWSRLRRITFRFGLVKQGRATALTGPQ